MRSISEAPCARCGYSGPGYYQSETHPCVAGQRSTRTTPNDLIEAFTHGYVAGILFGEARPKSELTLLLMRERAKQEAGARVRSGVLQASEEGQHGTTAD